MYKGHKWCPIVLAAERRFQPRSGAGSRNISERSVYVRFRTLEDPDILRHGRRRRGR